MYFEVFFSVRRNVFSVESNHSKIPEVQILFTTDSPPYSLFDLPQTSSVCAAQ